SAARTIVRPTAPATPYRVPPPTPPVSFGQQPGGPGKDPRQFMQSGQPGSTGSLRGIDLDGDGKISPSEAKLTEKALKESGVSPRSFSGGDRVFPGSDRGYSGGDRGPDGQRRDRR
ncbi:MAG: hypothetical protein AB1705_19025, partial [Verrucomicrobiota bacterium]